MFKKIDHINIVVSNLNDTKEFFIQFGFKEGHSGDLDGDWISSIVGLDNVQARYVTLSLPETQTNLELIEYITPPSDSDSKMSKANQLGYRHIALEVENIDEMVKKLNENGIECLSPVQTYPKTGKKLVYFLGPDGILLELAEYMVS